MAQGDLTTEKSDAAAEREAPEWRRGDVTSGVDVLSVESGDRRRHRRRQRISIQIISEFHDMTRPVADFPGTPPWVRLRFVAVDKPARNLTGAFREIGTFCTREYGRCR